MKYLLLIPFALLAAIGLRAWDWYQMPEHAVSGPWSEPACFDGHCISMRAVTPPRPPFMEYVVGRPAQDDLQLDKRDAALRALAYDMERCGRPRENISAILKFYMPGGDEAIRRFWARVDTDTHRPWFDCETR